MLLFSLPYAGGSSVIFYKWKSYLHSSIELYPIELKGRGKRFNENFYESIEEAVDAIFNQIKDEIVYNDYAIYGHSMGSIIAYELCYKICKNDVRKPKYIFFSVREPPDSKIKKDSIHNLQDQDFINRIMGFGGTSKELINNNQLLDVFLPILRSDFRMIETYKYKEKLNSIQCNITVMYGKQDPVSFENLLAWEKHCSGKVNIYNFEGNHFFKQEC